MFHLIEHALLKDRITRLRDKRTTVREFRDLVREVTLVIAAEAVRDLDLSTVEVDTPLMRTAGSRLKHRIVAVPVLRAGLGMTEAVRMLIPDVYFGHIGLARNEETLQPVQYYCKHPKGLENCTVLLLDPMLATGGSSAAAVSRIKDAGGRRIRFLNIIAAPEGVEAMEKAHPDVEIYSAALDKSLNEHGYILPGLGDAGDRIFGTL